MKTACDSRFGSILYENRAFGAGGNASGCGGLSLANCGALQGQTALGLWNKCFPHAYETLNIQESGSQQLNELVEDYRVWVHLVVVEYILT